VQSRVLALGLVVIPLLAFAGEANESLLGKPAVGKNADGHLEVFKVGGSGELLHRWQKLADGNWSSWCSLGGNLVPGLALTTNGDGTLEVFGVDRDSGALCLIRQAAPNSSEWSEWANMGGTLRPPVAVGQNLDGRLEVFAVDANTCAAVHLWQTDSQGHWSAWAERGGNLAPGLALVRNRDGRLELFGVHSDNGALVHCWQLHFNNSEEWSDWVDLGGSVLPGFVVAQNILGRLEVFGVSRADGRVKRICQAVAGESLRWSNWEDFSGDSKSISGEVKDASRNFPGPQGLARKVRTGLATSQSEDGRLEVFAISLTNNNLLHRWENFSDGSDRWSSWASLGKQAQPFPAVIANEDGNLEVFAVDLNNSDILNHRRQISHASDWLDWSSLDQPVFQYNSRTWQTDEGLPDNLVQAIAQTRDGFLWVGTRDGLARFDGVDFTSYNAKNTPEIENSSITALCSDPIGNLWIGTDGGGLVCLSNGTFSHYSKTNGLAGNTIRAVFAALNGTVWIGTTTGLSRFEDGKFINYSTNNGLLSDVVRCIYEDRGRNLWIATGAGLNRLNGTNFHSFVMPNGLPNDSVRVICQDQGGRIWIGSNNGMLWYDWYWPDHFYAYNTSYGISDTFVSAICEDAGGNLWVGTYSGLNRFHEGRFYVERDLDSAAFGKVNALFADREGDIWVGSNEGLVRLTPMRFTTYTKQQGLAHNNVMSVLEDRIGNLWLGTWGGGLDCLRDERIQAYAATNFFQNLVLSLCQERDGSLWIGADYDGGLTRLQDGKSTHYGARDGLINAGIRVLHQDRQGNLWIGTSRGLSCLKSGKFYDFSVKDHLSRNVVHAICEDHQGRLWFGTEGGLSRWEDGQFATLTTSNGLSDDTVTALYEDKAENLWIGTQAGGLNRYRDGKIRAYTTAQGLISNEIFEILEDDQGWLWMSCSKGVFRARKEDLDRLDHGKASAIACSAYGKSDGMKSPQCNGLGKPAGWKARDGRLWFPTSKGLVSVDPKTAKVDLQPPAVFIERLFADKKLIQRSEPIRRNADALASAPDAEDAPLKIAPGRGELDFRYTALDLQAPERIRFKYRLEGMDADWVDAGDRREAHYNVPPGKYRFDVAACNKDGIWNMAGASLAIVLQPHFWQTWWFQSGAVLLIIGSAGGTARYVETRRLRRRLQLLEQLHAVERERGRIAKDIHDDLGSSLTRIMMLGERAEEGLVNHEEVGLHVRKIIASARGTVQSLDEIVWAINPENDTLDGLVSYISHYADEFFESTNISCRLEVPDKLPSVILPAEVRHDLFLVVKETFNNCLKHSGASVIRLCVSSQADFMTIRIEDNGCGFESNVPGSGRKGNGLQNMRKRINSLGDQFTITSAPGQGTQVSFTVKLNQKRLPG
jgi:ligand-binding sensor domain-containing protein/signal transduction histidine kinase